MNRYVLFLMVLLSLLPFGCETQQFPGQPAIASSIAWPPEIKQGEKVEIAKNLLAKNYYVVLDSSGSMSESKCAEGSTKSAVSKRAFTEFVGVVPVQANPQDSVTFQATRLSGSDALAVRASKKLRSEELLVTSLGPTILKKHLDDVPLWPEGRVSVRQLIDYFAT